MAGDTENPTQKDAPAQEESPSENKSLVESQHGDKVTVEAQSKDKNPVVDITKVGKQAETAPGTTDNTEAEKQDETREGTTDNADTATNLHPPAQTETPMELDCPKDNADTTAAALPPTQAETPMELDHSKGQKSVDLETLVVLTSVETQPEVYVQPAIQNDAVNGQAPTIQPRTKNQMPFEMESSVDIEIVKEVVKPQNDKHAHSEISSNGKGKHAAFLAANPISTKKRRLQSSSKQDEANVPLHLIPFEEIDSEGRKEQADYIKFAEHHYREKENGRVTDRSEIEFIKCRQKEAERRDRVNVRREAMQMEASEKSLFVSADTHSSDDDARNSDIQLIGAQPSKKRQKKTLKDSLATTAENILEMAMREQRLEAYRSKRDAKPKAGNKPVKKSIAPKLKKKKINQSTLGDLMHVSNIFDESVETREDGKDETRFNRGESISSDKKQALREIIASLDDQEKELAELDRPAIHKASTEFRGIGLCKLTESGWAIKGLKTPLKHFQMIGASWMVKRETHKRDPEAHSGLLADEMGLGKTIMTLALIMNEIAAAEKSKTPKKLGPTLIICPSSLVFNWENEMMKHCDLELLERFGMPYTWSHKNAVNSFMTLNVLRSASIVITTPGELQRSYKKISFPPELQSENEKALWLEDNRHLYRGPLFLVEWNRIVVDEATMMKNHLSITSLAIRELIAKHRFALSGTPLMNIAEPELYSYFKFLRIPKIGDFKTFRHNFNLTAPAGLSRVKAVIKKYMLRRTYDDKVMGQKLVVLPRATKSEGWGVMNHIERKVYNMIEHRMLQKLQNLNSKNCLSMSYALLQLMRLRQCSAHILLILDIVKDILNSEDISELERFTESMASVESEELFEGQLREMRKLLKHCEKAKLNGDQSPIGEVYEDEELNGLAQNTSSHGLSYNFYKYLEELKETSGEKAVARHKSCGFCHCKLPDVPWVTSCNHLYCSGCLEELQVQAALRGDDKATCTLCLNPFQWCEELANPESISGLNSVSDASETEKSLKRTKQVRRMKWLLDEDPLPSAKTKVIMSQITNWIQEDPKSKIIIFSQFIGFLYIMHNILKKAGIHTVIFEGSMSIPDRKAAVDEYRDYDGPCVFVSSLRCGGMGLNLTMASKVINTDPWWNEALENQAFGRAYRIGQEKKTSFVRVFVRNTIDEKILIMQKQKALIIRSLMEAKEKLNLDQLLDLFGNSGNTESFVLGENRPETQSMLDDGAYMQWDK